jgi:hypothetical protein
MAHIKAKSTECQAFLRQALLPATPSRTRGLVYDTVMTVHWCAQGSDLSLQDCDVSSSTGSGVGIEGGAPLIGRCTVHNCERHGVAIFSELGGSEGVMCLVGLMCGCMMAPSTSLIGSSAMLGAIAFACASW